MRILRGHIHRKPLRPRHRPHRSHPRTSRLTPRRHKRIALNPQHPAQRRHHPDRLRAGGKQRVHLRLRQHHPHLPGKTGSLTRHQRTQPRPTPWQPNPNRPHPGRHLRLLYQSIRLHCHGPRTAAQHPPRQKPLLQPKQQPPHPLQAQHHQRRQRGLNEPRPNSIPHCPAQSLGNPKKPSRCGGTLPRNHEQNTNKPCGRVQPKSQTQNNPKECCSSDPHQRPKGPWHSFGYAASLNFQISQAIPRSQRLLACSAATSNTRFSRICFASGHILKMLHLGPAAGELS